MDLFFSGISGWILALLLPLTIALPFLLRRVKPGVSGRYPLVQRLWPHYWLGYAIVALAVIHAWIATGTGLALRANTTGVYLATGALFLVFAQVFLGLLLRVPSLRRRTEVQRRHFWVMVGIVTLTLGHIALNSVLVHRLIG
jgi:hypothetical protein